MRYDPITRSMKLIQLNINNTPSSNNSVIPVSNTALTYKQSQRSYSGLGSDRTSSPELSLISKGLSGIARQYINNQDNTV
jgi:hypothetical protein